MAAAYSETHAHLRARVLPYPRAIFNIDSPERMWAVHLMRLFLSLLLVVVAVNVPTNVIRGALDLPRFRSKLSSTYSSYLS